MVYVIGERDGVGGLMEQDHGFTIVLFCAARASCLCDFYHSHTDVFSLREGASSGAAVFPCVAGTSAWAMCITRHMSHLLSCFSNPGMQFYFIRFTLFMTYEGLNFHMGKREARAPF